MKQNRSKGITGVTPLPQSEIGHSKLVPMTKNIQMVCFWVEGLFVRSSLAERCLFWDYLNLKRVRVVAMKLISGLELDSSNVQIFNCCSIIFIIYFWFLARILANLDIRSSLRDDFISSSFSNYMRGNFLGPATRFSTLLKWFLIIGLFKSPETGFSFWLLEVILSE